MAGFGGAIKLTGESEYRRALNQIQQNLREVASEMKMVSSQYGSADKSTQALTAKEQVLNKQLEEQKTKLSVLKQQYSVMTQQYSEQTQKHNALVKSYQDEKQKLEEIGRTLGTSSKEYKDQQSKVEDLANEVKRSSKAQDDNAKSMSKMRIEINNAQSDINKTTNEIKDLGKETEDAGKKAEESKSGWSSWGQTLADIRTKIIGGLVQGIKQLTGMLINVGKQAVDQYGRFQQLEGGVKKIFGDDVYQQVVENSQIAFKTAQMSANEYLDTVTSFSASLINELGKDSVDAVNYADMAVRDMADNMNTFGTDIDSIRSAYAGFAKDNYTMLDNLKLGYGGNATEMARLINDTGVLGDSIEVTAQTVKDVPFSKIVEAIHVMQDELHIANTSWNEAGTTLEGTAGSMRSAWQNLLLGMAQDNADFAQLVDNFVGTIISPDGKEGIIPQFLPRIKNVIAGVATLVTELIPVLIEEVLPVIVESIMGMLPTLAESLTTVIQFMTTTLVDLLPEFIPVATDIILTIVDTIIDNLDKIIESAIEIMITLTTAIIDHIPDLAERIPEIVIKIAQVIWDNLPKIIQAGINLISALIQGIFAMAVTMVSKIYHFWDDNIATPLNEKLQKVYDVGLNIVKGIWEGISNGYSWIVSKISGWVSNVLQFIKNAFGIRSPSKLMEDEVGKWLALGVGEGFDDEMDDVSKEMANAIPHSFDVNPSINASIVGDQRDYAMANAFRIALDDALTDRLDSLGETFTEGFGKILKLGVYLDDGTLVGKLAPKMNRQLGQIYGG